MTASDHANVRLTLARLTDRRIVGWPLLLGLLVIFLVDGFPFLGGSELDGSNLDRAGLVLQAAAVAWVVAAVALMIGRYTVLALAVARRRPVLTVTWFFVVSLLGDVVFQGVIASGSDGRYIAASLVDQVAYKTAGLVLLALVISSLSDYRSTVRTLEQARHQLLDSRQAAARLEATERLGVASTVTDSIELARQAVATQRPSEALTVLRSATRDLVRPLSHELASASADFTPPPVTPMVRPSWRTTLRRVADAPLIAPRAMAWAMVVLGFRQTVTWEADTPANTTDDALAVTFDAGRFVESVSVLAVIFFATYWAARLVRSAIADRAVKAPLARRAAINGLGVVAIAIATLVAVALGFLLPWFPEPPSVRWWTPLLTLIPLAVIASVHGLTRSIATHRATVIEQLEVANGDIRWEIAAINERLWHHRRHLAHDVHGPVQSALNAAAHRLATLTDSDMGDDKRREVVAAVDELLTQSAAALTHLDRPAVDLGEGLDDIVALWQGVCGISIDVDPAVHQHVETDPACVSAILAIVGEACANAAQHGGATQAEVRIALTDARTAQVSVRDNGRGSSGDSSPGLGSQLLTEVTLDWALTTDDTGTVLVAHLPVGTM
jgi:signal transduction histidine kinase